MITKKEAYEYGYWRGVDAATDCDYREDEDKYAAASESEENSRQYADFCDSDLCEMPCDYRYYEAVWESYEQGVTDGINSVLE